MTISGFVAYVKQMWKNKPDRSTPVTAERLLHMEEGIKGNSDAVEKIAAAVISQIINDPEKIASMAALFAVNEKVAKLNSDIESANVKFKNYYSLLRPTVEIPMNADLNDYTEPGNYMTVNAAVSETIKNTPYTTTGFKLSVEVLSSNMHKMQTIKASAAKAIIWRTLDRDTWSEWHEM